MQSHHRIESFLIKKLWIARRLRTRGSLLKKKSKRSITELKLVCHACVRTQQQGTHIANVDCNHLRARLCFLWEWNVYPPLKPVARRRIADHGLRTAYAVTRRLAGLGDREHKQHKQQKQTTRSAARFIRTQTGENARPRHGMKGGLADEASLCRGPKECSLPPTPTAPPSTAPRLSNAGGA